MTKRPPLVSIVVVFVAVILAAAVALIFMRNGDSPVIYSSRANPSDPELVAWGLDVYDQSCASCHGADLQGQPNWRARKADGTLPAPPHDETGHTWHHSDNQLFQLTKWGTTAVVGGDYESGMPGFSDKLDDADIWAVLAYIKSQWPAHIQAAQADRSSR